MMAALALCGLIAVSLAGYGLFGERRRLRVVRHTIRSRRVPPGFDGITIVQFSDVHLGPYYSLRQLDELVNAINSLRPDLVAFTGDLHDARRKDNIAKYDPSPVLSRIQARLGKFAVYGNHDFGYERKLRSSGAFLSRGGFTVLINDARRVTLPGGEFMTIAGLDDCMLGKPNPSKAASKLHPDRFNVLLVHEPDVADRLARYPIDLQLSGHSHGGQVVLPLVGALVRTSLGRKYVGGLYRIGSRFRDKRPYVLHVNRGVGTTRIPVRIRCVPELTVITLRCEEQSRD
ncbi:metallophosphoesterase [Cohnella hongkongensis]|uniref:Metallophosphoesterase n=1 Tax=Cohnella hongkongensis TaxID=178337 RepID=A0ABV9F4K4_9BACL